MSVGGTIKISRMDLKEVDTIHKNGITQISEAAINTRYMKIRLLFALIFLRTLDKPKHLVFFQISSS